MSGRSELAIAQNVMVRDYIPTGTTYEAGSGTFDGIAYPDSSLYDTTRKCVTWHVDRMDVDVDERVVFSYRVVVTNTVDASGKPMTIRNVALFDTDVPPSATTDPTTPTNPVENPTLTYTKEASPSGNVREGQVITVEPFLSMGGIWADEGRDGWTLYSRPAAPVVQFEHTVVATRNGPLILTQPG